MDKDHKTIQDSHNEAGVEKINKLEKKIKTTQHNIEVSKEIIGDTPSDTQRGKLQEKNTQRKHAVGSMKKEIRDIEQTLKERNRETST